MGIVGGVETKVSSQGEDVVRIKGMWMTTEAAKNVGAI